VKRRSGSCKSFFAGYLSAPRLAIGFKPCDMFVHGQVRSGNSLILSRCRLRVNEASMPLTGRSQTCDDCGAAHDCDHNAAGTLNDWRRCKPMENCALARAPRETQIRETGKTRTVDDIFAFQLI
jgi:hypothetical protein